MKELFIRICPTHLVPVAILSERPEFLCLVKYHRMEIEDTKELQIDENNLPKTFTSQIEENTKKE